MNIASLLDKAPELVLALGVVLAIGWFRKQDLQRMTAMQSQMMQMHRFAPSPNDEQPGPDDTGRHTVSTNPLGAISERLTSIDRSLVTVTEKVDEEIRESRRFREDIAPRTKALETSVSFLRNGKDRRDG